MYSALVERGESFKRLFSRRGLGSTWLEDVELDVELELEGWFVVLFSRGGWRDVWMFVAVIVTLS